MTKQQATFIVREYLNLVKLSLRRIEPGYYKLATTYEPSGIVRERAFCYELYHQIRSNMEPHHRLSPNGEIDKRGHVDFEPQDRKNPDFVFHIPGTHEGDTIVIEVKGTLEREPDDIVKDFQTILTFISKYRYKAGIFILYNHSFDEMVDKFGQELGELTSHRNASSVYVLSIKEPMGVCEEHIFSQFRA